MVFQDAVGSLNPRMTIGQTLAEVLSVYNLCKKEERATRIATLLDEVGLPAEVALAYPRELSGGQCQRISIARALAMNPRVIIADEPVSALDVSVQARVLNLLADLRQKRNLTILLISHDLAVVRTVCDRLIVMNAGEIVERGDAKTLFANPQHPYTQNLLAAVPDIAEAY
jgi:peptide/nickel transport system ATP-binding protein